jgi:hypothetical protein
MKRWQTLLLALAVSAVMLYFTLQGVDLQSMADALTRADYVYMIPVILIFIPSLVVRGVRWRALLAGRLPMKHAIHITNASYMLNGVLPMRLGEVGRAFMAKRQGVPVVTALSSIVVERIIDMIMVVALLGFVLLSLPVSREIAITGAVMGAAAIAALVVLIVLARRPDWARRFLTWITERLPILDRLGLHRFLDSLLAGLDSLGTWRSLFAIIFWSVVGWLFSVIAGYLLMFTMFDDPAPSLAVAALFIAMASLAIALPPSVAALGVFEGSVKLALVSQGYPDHLSTSFAFLLHGLNLFMYVSSGIIGLIAEGVSMGEVISASERGEVENDDEIDDARFEAAEN